jgi:hypothetical protein
MADEEPLYPWYDTYEKRLVSFLDPQWPHNCPVPPEELAAAGLYYYGCFVYFRDAVKCFHCGKGLCLWEQGDTAWGEHRRLSPNCQYVINNHPDAIANRQLSSCFVTGAVCWIAITLLIGYGL